MSETLLPASSGAFTRALAAIFDTHGRFAPLIGQVKHYGVTIVPDDWVPWLIYDLGLEDVIPYVRTFRQVLAEGPEWQATRGTPRGIQIGIGWVESEGVVQPPDGRHDWWEFQVAFTEPPTDVAQIRQLEGIINLSKSSEDELFRMVSPDRDHRPVRMDKHRMDTGGQFDGYSGEQLWDGGPLISFGWAATLDVEFDVNLSESVEVLTTDVISYFDGGFRLDRRRFGGRPLRIAFASLELDDATAVTERRDMWPSFYPTGSWNAGADTMPLPTPLEIA